MERRPVDDPRAPVEPRPAATIVLVRPAAGQADGRDSLEVLLTRRPDSMAFAAGLHVFPGGRVEPADADPRLVGRARGPRHEPDFQVAHRIAAIRETWEEVGVLLAERRDGGRPVLAERRHDADFAGLCADLDLELATDELVEIARWTTPRAYPRRFDARFFAAELPPGATLAPDPHEVVAHAWLTPRAALAAMAAGTIGLWPPTSTTLQRLERAPSFAAIRAGLGRAPEPPIRVERIDRAVRVMTGQSAFGPTGRPANTVLVGRREVVVVDPGDPGEAFLDAVEAEVERGGGRIVAIGLTHVDPGHAAGSEELRARTGAPILAGPGGDRPLSWAVDEIADGATVGSGHGALTALATPGHRPDHLAFVTADRTLIAGDALTDPPVPLLPPEGDPAAQLATLDRLAALLADGSVRRVVPGHGPAILPDPAGALARSASAARSAV
jgi:glyoxylase-like metal-dependent hydrolase (beta-lactamase superfamily II)/8-oxo-dGTP pyrophosphatase MutT (NUDIX family)